MTAAATLLRCFGCDRVTRDEAKVVVAADGRLRCHECAAYEAALAAPAEEPRVLVFPYEVKAATRGLGPRQREGLRSVARLGRIVGMTPRQYRPVIRALVERGLVEHVSDSEYRLTPLGRAAS